jgi:YVTN family beta-propeller protein
MMKQLKHYYFLACLVLGLSFMSSCEEKDETGLSNIPDVVVINEGSYSSGTGDFTTFNTNTKEVQKDVFSTKNSISMDAIIQTVTVFNGNYYAVCNAEDKVEVINGENFSYKGTIESTLSVPLKNPYSFAAVGNKGYISNWGEYDESWNLSGHFIAKVDLTNNKITGKIDRDVQPQHLLAVNGKIYIANLGGNTISVLNPTTDEIEKNITVSDGPDKMVLDKNGKLWVLCTSGNLVRINPSDNTVETTITGIQSSGFNEKMVRNFTGDKLYYLSSNKVYVISIDASSVPVEPLITGSKWYGLGIDKNDIIYIGVATSYTSNGKVERYNLSGTKLDEFDCGVAPNGFIFRIIL